MKNACLIQGMGCWVMCAVVAAGMSACTEVEYTYEEIADSAVAANQRDIERVLRLKGELDSAEVRIVVQNFEVFSEVVSSGEFDKVVPIHFSLLADASDSGRAGSRVTVIPRGPKDYFSEVIAHVEEFDHFTIEVNGDEYYIEWDDRYKHAALWLYRPRYFGLTLEYRINVYFGPGALFVH